VTRLKSCSFLTCVVAALATGACEDSFSPTSSTDRALSVFGYLDAAADIQWIRVMPIRPLALTSPDSFGIDVTLEDLGTNRVIVLRDSVFLFSHYADPELGSEGAYVHNYWTTEPIEPGGIYRFSAARSGEKTAEAEVAIPMDYDVEVWIAQGRNESDYLRAEGLKHVPFVTANAHFFDRCGSSVDSVWFKNRSTEGDTQVIPIRKSPVTPREGCGTFRVESRDLWIVGSESEWPSGQEYSAWALAISDRPSNVSNAVGFLGGVLTKVVPYENCTFQTGMGTSPAYCQLRYAPESATLRGTIVETRCGDGLMDTVTVEIRELNTQPASARKVRSTFTNPLGRFEIGALEAGVQYSLRARAKPEPDPFWGEVDIHTIHTDTLEFNPGEVLTYDIGLRRLTACGVGL